MTELTFSSLPAVLPAFGRVAVSRGSHDRTLSEPLLARAPGVRAQAARVRSYGRVCGADASQTLPICYPQVLALPLQLHLMGHHSFPLPVIGLVHINNQIEQQRDLALDEEFDIEVAIDGIEATSRGHEFDLKTRFVAAGETVWSGTAHILSRGSSAGSGGGKRPPAVAPDLPVIADWEVAANTGRRYARVSGDVNPIHLSALSAKMLGFRRAIAHGMWTLARSAAALPQAAQGECRLDVQFKTPVFLPAQVRLYGAAQDDGFHFEVADAGSHKPHLSGCLQNLS